MKIIVNINPRVVTAKTKSELMYKLPSICTYGSYGSYASNFASRNVDETATVYNIRKINNKAKQTKDKNGKTIKSVVIRQKQWIANVYDFKIDFLRVTGLRVDQTKDTFVISKRKK
jgi:hypothetical protein